MLWTIIVLLSEVSKILTNWRRSQIHSASSRDDDTLRSKYSNGISDVPNGKCQSTPLSQLDMFRSTVVMQAQTVLELSNEHITQLLGFLRHIEETFIKKYPSEKDRGKKIDQLMKYWLWIRRGTDAGGVSYIMRMVEDCLNHKTLIELVFDLYQHVLVWCGTEEIKGIDVSCSRIPHDNPLHPIFPKVTEGWKLFALAVRTARISRRGHALARDRKICYSV